MRSNPDYALDDAAEQRRLIRHHPWALLVSATSRGLVASHLPVLLEDTADGSLSLVSHLGRPDEELHEFGEHEVLLVFQGAHAYISPRWYAATPAVPTWNFSAVHVTGRVEVLPHDENYAVLSATVDTFEHGAENPFRLADVAEYAERIAHGTIGFRVVATGVDAKRKHSQDKPTEIVDRVIAHLHDGAGLAPLLADEMRRTHAR